MSKTEWTPKERAEYAQRVFIKFAMTDAQRIAHGMATREWMHDQLRQDLHPDHYRIHWLRSSARKVMEQLKKITEAFNYSHADDHATVYDLLDILETAKSDYRKQRDRGVRGV